MALSTAITVQQMLDQIKVEARIDGADNYDLTILAIINELLLDYSEGQRYSQFLVISPVIQGIPQTGIYPLPADYANMRKVYWSRAGQPDYSRVINEKSSFVEFSRDGSEPKYYELIGQSFRLFPFNNIVATDSIWLEYWAIPTALGLNDTFPVPKLIVPIKRAAIARMHAINKEWTGAQIMAKSAADSSDKEQTTEDNSDL